MGWNAFSGRGEVNCPKMAGPASSTTVDIMSGLETAGKEAVESRGEVISDPSSTGRIGSPWPVDGSILCAEPHKDISVLRIWSRLNEFQHLVSEAEQLIREL
jgi:hypothetical protein